MAKKVQELIIPQVAEIFKLPEHTLRARLRKYGHKFLHHKQDETDRYIIFRDDFFEEQLRLEKLRPRRSPKAAQMELSRRVDELQKKYAELLRAYEEIRPFLKSSRK